MIGRDKSFQCVAIAFSSRDHRDEFMTFAMLKDYGPTFRELVQTTNLRVHNGRDYAFWLFDMGISQTTLRMPLIDILDELRAVRKRSYAGRVYNYTPQHGLSVQEFMAGTAGRNAMARLREAVEPTLAKGGHVRMEFHGERAE